MVPDRFTPEHVELKRSIVGCTKKDVFRTGLIQAIINEDWQNFAQAYAYVDFSFYLCFVVLTEA